MHIKITAGESARFEVEVKDVNNNAIDPGGIKFMLKNPAQVVTTYTYGTDVAVEKTSTGKYIMQVILPSPGQYVARWETAFPHVAIEEEEFEVLPSLI